MFSLLDASSAEYSDVPSTIGAFALGLEVRENELVFLKFIHLSEVWRKEIFAKASPSSHLLVSRRIDCAAQKKEDNTRPFYP